MRLKTFSAPSMTEAMARVRDALGPDAVIVNTSKHGNFVSITAAVESSPPKVGRHPATTPNEETPPNRTLEELAQLDQETIPDFSVEHYLSHHGVPKVLSRRLQNTAAAMDAENAQMALAAALDTLFRFAPVTELTQRRPLMIVGPPGAGKTVTLGKLASQAVLAERTVKIISTDTMRTGGLSQLEGYAELLKQHVYEAASPDEIAAAIGEDHDSYTLIDTPGLNPFNADEVAILDSYIKAADVEPVLVLPAGTDPMEATEYSEIYAGLGCQRLICTRLDVARRFACLLSAADAGPLAFAGVSITPYLAEGLQPASAQSLSQLLTTLPQKNIFHSLNQKAAQGKLI
ncbi:MAG: hypothetical protein CMF31_01115 [Kordiimonas sp.]|nr:hypothetical protein [Kordiimonas sp.]